MAVLSFKDLDFELKDGFLRVNFLDLFFFDLLEQDVEKIAFFKVSKNEIVFKGISSHKANNKFNFLLAKGFEDLKSKLTKKPVVYIHQLSGIPLIGSNVFGLIDRNTSIIEVRIITGCNLDCLYCSVNQDKRSTDFVVEKDYLVKEFKKLVFHKQISGIEAHIGTQGEPLLYKPLPDLISDLAAIPEVSTIALDTNGVLLTKNNVDELVKAGLTRFCFSINALDPILAKKIAGSCYNLDYVKDILTYISKKDVQLILTPVWVPGVNDKEIPKLIEFSKELKAGIGIQNFLNYKWGKNPVSQMDWDTFIEKMKVLEKDHDVHLLFNFKEDFDVRETKSLPKPFKKGDLIKAQIVCPGRLPDESIAVAKNRVITFSNPLHKSGNVRLKITRSKHNVFYGVTL